jgi:1,4-dihydroxy-2-naphthoate octaprenyltransferase
MKVSPWIEAARPKTLPAAVIPVLVGSAMAYASGAFAWAPAVVCLAFSLLVQVGANFANDYADYEHGADNAQRTGPRRAVASGLISFDAMRRGAFAVLAAAFVLGLSLVWLRGWELLPLGVLSVIFSWAYTGGPYPLAYHGLGDVFVFVFFGLVAVCGTFYVLTGLLDWSVVLAAIPIGLLATNLLVVNNYRDIVVDERAGKHTLIVRFGRGFGRRQYVVSLVISCAIPVALAAAFGRPLLAGAAIAVLPGFAVWRRLSVVDDGPGFNRLLAQTAGVLLLFGCVWALVLGTGPQLR